MAGKSQWAAGRLVPLVKLAIFTFLVPCSVTLWLPYTLYRDFRLQKIEPGAATLVAIPLISLGAAGYLWCALDFAFVGRGTPAPIDHPKVLVVQGLYRYVRNPMYISVGLVLLAESLLFRSRALMLYMLAWWVIVHLFVILYEEPTLRHKFGASYEEYCGSVRRWIPRLSLKRTGSSLAGGPR